MTLYPHPHTSGPAPRKTQRSIRNRQLALALGLTLVPLIVVIGSLMLSTSSVIDQLQTISSENLRSQAETYLVQLNASVAGESALILDQAARDIQSVANAASTIYSDKVNLPGISVGMVVGPDRQLMNTASDVSSVFVPNTTWKDTDYNKALYEAVMRDIELSTYLDLTLPGVKDNNPNSAAVYLGTVNNVLRYYPNIRLGELVPADFSVTQRPWYLTSIEENEGKTEPTPVWSPVYYDATGLGLVTTIAVPVYSEAGELIGVAGLDVTLTEVQRNIENAQFLNTGYSFLVDEGGNAIILTDEGHQAMLDSKPDPDQPMPNLMATRNAEFKTILEKMVAGESGFAAIRLGGREVFLAYSPLRQPSDAELIAPAWSLGSVVSMDDVLADLIGSSGELQRTIQISVFTRILPIGVLVAAVLISIAYLGVHRLVRPILRLASAAHQLGSGDWETPVTVLSEVETNNPDEIGLLAGTLRTMGAQLRQTIGQLEQRVAERTQALEHRTLQMQTAAEVARDIALSQDLDSLLQNAVDLISQRFGYYNVGIFMVDETNDWAYLKAASGALGQKLVEREIRFQVGQAGLIGYVTRFGQPRRSDDVQLDHAYVAEPLLNETRAEVTLPLRSGPKMIGALDVQSTEPAAFSDDDVTVLQTLANQLATAIENVRLVSRMQATLDETNMAFQQQARLAWSRLLQHTGNLEYEYDRLQVKPMAHDTQPKGLRVPVRLRDQLLGYIGLENEDPEHVWSADELAIIEATANQAALTIENARLLSESRRLAVREQITTNVTAKMRASLDMETVLQTAVREIAQQLSIAEVEINLSLDTHETHEPPDVVDLEPQDEIDLETAVCKDQISGHNGSDCTELVSAGGTNNRNGSRRLRSLGRSRHGAQ